MSDRSDTTDEILAFLAGAAAGVVIALLFAPRSGDQTRARVSRWMADIGERGEEAFDEGAEGFEDFQKAHRGDKA